MKKLLFSLFICSSAIAQSNYYSLSYSNNIAHGLAKFHFDKAYYTDTTNTTAVAGFTGYVYPSNFSGTTKWIYPPRILITTNAIVSFNCLTTNAATALAGTYRMQLYTNNPAAPFYDSGDVVWLQSTLPPYNTNITLITITNAFTNSVLTNLSYFTNVNMATFSIKVGPVVGAWNTMWITDGDIRF